MRLIFITFLFLIINYSFGQNTITTNVINNSRNSCVKIISKKGNSSGTGFFVSKDIVATCFHVIAQISVDNPNNVSFNIFNDLQAVNEEGDTVSLSCISIPTNQSSEPLFQDFALLRTGKIVSNKAILPLSTDISHNIAEPIIFTGYPLGTPTMVSHSGTISGITKDKSIICVQASTNKGNSGGALVDKNGKVIGIISMREGGISFGLQTYLNQINESEKMGSVQLMGVDPLQTAKETIMVLDTYISTGIGYARNIKYLNDYIQKHNIKF